MGWLFPALVGLCYLALGPWALILAGALLAIPRVRQRLPRPRFSRRGLGIAGSVLLVIVGFVVFLPDGWLSIPSSGGRLVTPSYVGRQVAADPIEAEPLAPHPWLAAGTAGAGPLGDLTEVDTAWFGRDQCGSLQFDSRGRIVALCSDRNGPMVRVIDAGTMRPLVTKRLPEGESECEPYSFLDNGDRAVVTTADRRIQAISTADADGEPDLTVTSSWNLRKLMPASDCLVATIPDWAGRIWWSTRAGLVGVLDPVSGGAQVLDLKERVGNAMAVDETGVYLVTDAALYRLTTDAAGAPVVGWRSEYDAGVERKSGQLSQGSGTPPTLLEHNLVAIADNAEPRLHVVFVDRATGAQVCSAAVFDGGESSTETALTSLGSGVVVENNHGYSSTRSTMLGFGATGGLARVDHHEGECTVVWTNQEVASSAVPVASWANGLVYAWTKRSTRWGVAGWYLTAIDARSGETSFAVRAGTGSLFASDRAGLVVSPDSEVFVGTVAGLVRVRDRVRDEE